MVALIMPKSWLADLKARLASPITIDPPSDHHLGILAFEAAATMARLISIHNSLASPHLRHLRSDMRSQAISYLISPDQPYLLRLACADILSDLDRAADAVSRLSLRCSSPFPRAFSRTYPDAKNGSLMTLVEEFSLTKGSEKRIRKMDKQVATAARLYSEMDTLNDLEASERKMDEWKKHSGPIPMQQQQNTAAAVDNRSDLLRRELRAQRQRVCKLMGESLWQVSFDKAVSMMAKSALSILYRICLVFSQFVHGLPPVYYNMYDSLYSYTPKAKTKAKSSSGPMDSPKPAMYETAVRHSAPLFMRKDDKSKPQEKLVRCMVPPPSTVGSAGMALRYANVILAADKLLAMRSGDPHPQLSDQGEDGDEEDEWGTREELYEMLPVGVRAAVKAKLKECWKKDVHAVADRGVADGWGQVIKGLLSWLGPMARDTERWHEERNLDRMQRFATGPRTLMLKTLHFADLEKTEAAMVEVLVGLSCMCWYHEQRQRPLSRSIHESFIP
ncbi:hypothetical protein LUZ63_004589 [Rhynchospora breviuscula]|uniref:Uncharacterized protein n=1 Tax=Rhynchospora breviuscula TaxID=2022672 RepID=A0A9Q0CLA4_9POAL|nr:hypothetical protein LUZ63_004589 [Rhynchospora breviuscula]